MSESGASDDTSSSGSPLSLVEWLLLILYLFFFIHVERRYLERFFPSKIEQSVSRAKSLRAAVIHCVYWVVVAILFNFFVISYWLQEGEVWFSGYLLEYTLSVDNLFVFEVIFQTFRTPDTQIDKALVWGIGGAAVMRWVFFILGTKLIDWISWVKYPLGVLLLITAWRTVSTSHAPKRLGDLSSKSGAPTNDSMSQNLPPFVRMIKVCENCLPFVAQYDVSGNFWSYVGSPNLVDPVGGSLTASSENGVKSISESANAQSISSIRLTMLGAVVFSLTLVDIVFALDAVAAKVIQTRDVFINFSSSLFAMVSFRSLYHVIVELTVTFALLKYGIALVLAYVGFELIVSNWVEIPNHVSCVIILAICSGSIVGSLIIAKLFSKNSIQPDSDDFILDHVEMAAINNGIFGLTEDLDDMVGPVEVMSKAGKH